MTTGQLIKAARKKAGMTQKELGRRIGTTYQTLAQWENDLRKPKFETLQRIASALSIPVQELVEDWSTMDPEDVKDAIIFGGPINKVAENMKQLNLTGRERVLAYSADMVKIPEYRLEPTAAPQSTPALDTTPSPEGSEELPESK